MNYYLQLYKELNAEKKFWHQYILAALFSVAITYLSVFINQILIDHILPQKDLHTLVLFIVGLGGYYLFDIFTSVYKRYLGLHLKNKLDTFFLKKFDSKLNTFSLAYIQSFKKGDLIERVSDALKLKKFFTKFFTNLLIDGTITIYSLGVLAYMNWKLTLLLISVFVLFYKWFLYITPLLKRNEQIRYNQKALFLSKIIEKIEGLQLIKSFGIEENRSEKLSKNTTNYLKVQLKNGHINLVNTVGVSLILTTTTLFIVFILSYSLIIESIGTVGQMVTFIALSGKIFSSLKKMLSQNLSLQENVVILKRFLDFKEPKSATVPVNGIKEFNIETLSLNNSNFSYKQNPILKNVNIEVFKGEKIKIEGKNGSGKTTLCKIIALLYPTQQDSISINNQSMINFDTASLKKKIILASNDDILFNESLYENITLGKSIPYEQILSKSKEVGLFDFLNSKAERLRYLVAEKGKNLSTGQRKKIIVLRALLSNAEVIILDEVLSGIDDDSKVLIEHSINKDPRTFIIVSHEMTQKLQFSKIYSLEDYSLKIKTEDDFLFFNKKNCLKASSLSSSILYN